MDELEEIKTIMAATELALHEHPTKMPTPTEVQRRIVGSKWHVPKTRTVQAFLTVMEKVITVYRARGGGMLRARAIIMESPYQATTQDFIAQGLMRIDKGSLTFANKRFEQRMKKTLVPKKNGTPAQVAEIEALIAKILHPNVREFVFTRNDINHMRRIIEALEGNGVEWIKQLAERDPALKQRMQRAKEQYIIMASHTQQRARAKSSHLFSKPKTQNRKPKH